MSKISRLNSLPSGSLSQPGDIVILPDGREFILNNSSQWIKKKSGQYLEDKGVLSSEDLNIIINQGIYHQLNNNQATLLNNYPITSAGTLEIRYGSAIQIFQQYTVLAGQPGENDIYTRGNYNGVWSTWKKGWNTAYFTQQDIDIWKGLQAIVNTKENTITPGTTSQYFRGDKTFQELNKIVVGLSNVDNTADAIKAVQSAATLRNVNITLAQLDSMTLEPGIYNLEGYAIDTNNVPGMYFYIIQLGSYTGGGYSVQIAVPYSAGQNNGMYLRVALGGTWGSWERQAKFSDIETSITNALNGYATESWVTTNFTTNIDFQKYVPYTKKRTYFYSDSNQVIGTQVKRIYLPDSTVSDVEIKVNSSYYGAYSIGLLTMRLVYGTNTGLPWGIYFKCTEAIGAVLDNFYIEPTIHLDSASNRIYVNVHKKATAGNPFFIEVTIRSNQNNLTDDSVYFEQVTTTAIINAQNEVTYMPSAHTHTIGDVTGLQTALDGKTTETWVNSNFHKINYTGTQSNNSANNVNKSWFDYSWGGTGKSGLVTSSSGLNDTYVLELFGQYNSTEGVFGIRTRNGDISDPLLAWNPVRYLWHTGNFDATNVVHKTGAETIGGDKTFDNTVHAYNLKYTKSIDISNTDLNNLVTGGFYQGHTLTNSPEAGYFHVTVEAYDVDFVHHTATTLGSGNLPNKTYSRTKIGSLGWTPWKYLNEVKLSSRNYILDSLIRQFTNSFIHGFDNQGKYYDFVINGVFNLTKPNIFKANTQYILSFKFASSGQVGTSGDPYFRVEYTDGSFSSYLNNTNNPLVTDITKTVKTIQLTYASGGLIRIYNPMFIEGETLNVYEPAPEDLVSDFSVTDTTRFDYIKNKPTTASGYGITDVVTLTGLQTISDTKYFRGTGQPFVVGSTVKTANYITWIQDNGTGLAYIGGDGGAAAGGGDGTGFVVKAIYNLKLYGTNLTYNDKIVPTFEADGKLLINNAVVQTLSGVNPWTDGNPSYKITVPSLSNMYGGFNVPSSNKIEYVVGNSSAFGIFDFRVANLTVNDKIVPTFETDGSLLVSGYLTAGNITLGGAPGKLRFTDNGAEEIYLVGASNGFAKLKALNFYTLYHGDSTQWQAAYSWGNHASAGYATQTWSNSTFIPKTHPVFALTSNKINNFVSWNSSSPNSTDLILSDASFGDDVGLYDISDDSLLAGLVQGEVIPYYYYGVEDGGSAPESTRIGLTINKSNKKQVGIGCRNNETDTKLKVIGNTLLDGDLEVKGTIIAESIVLPASTGFNVILDNGTTLGLDKLRSDHFIITSNLDISTVAQPIGRTINIICKGTGSIDIDFPAIDNSYYNTTFNIMNVTGNAINILIDSVSIYNTGNTKKVTVQFTTDGWLFIDDSGYCIMV